MSALNSSKHFFSKLFRFLVVGMSAMVLLFLAAGSLVSDFTQPGPKTVSAFVCSATDYGSLSNKDQWCACAAQNNDTGSMVREGCSQTVYLGLPATGGGASAPSCNTLVTSSVCGQPSYNNCTLKYDGNRAYYDCFASQNSACQGKLYCSALDRQSTSNPAPSNVAPTCDGVNKISTCGQSTYDTCELRYEGNRAYYACYARQNNSCSGKYYCGSLDRNQRVSNGTNPPANCPAGSTPQQNSQGTNICVANVNTNSNNNSNTVGGATAYAQGGSANVTINQAAQKETVREIKVVTAGQVKGTQVKELPKTGLPLLAYATAAFIPLGFRFKKFGGNLSKDARNHSQFLWEERQFKSS